MKAPPTPQKEGHRINRDIRIPEVMLIDQEGQNKGVTPIADALALSPKTVSVYRARILEKLGVANNVEIARYALQHGLTGAAE